MSIDSVTANTLKKIEKVTGGKLTLGKLIWAIRKCEEESQVEFAKKLGVSKQRLCDIEHDRAAISPRLAAEYAEILGESKDQFIRLAIQDYLDREGLDYEVSVIRAA